jgi:hypothetical protein
MHRHAPRRWPAALAAALALTAIAPSAAAGTAEGELYYTRYQGVSTERVRKVAYSYDGSALVLGSPQPIPGSLPGADGIVFAPDQDLLIGGQSQYLHKLDPMTGVVESQAGQGPSPNLYHVMLDPLGDRAWAAGIPGDIVEFPLGPFGPGTVHDVTGDDGSVVQITWAQGEAFYTTSNGSGTGHFGRIDMSTFQTTRLLANVPWAHGMSYDEENGILFAFGGTWIAQIDPRAPRTIVSTLQFPSGITTLDQGTVDGEGHLFIAANNGNLVFIDYSQTLLVGDPANFVSVQFLESFLDDVAPLSGSGSPCDTPAAVQGYGPGWPGTAGREPQLEVVLPAATGLPATLRVTGSSSLPSQGCLVIGTRRAELDRGLGGLVLVDPESYVDVLFVDAPAWPGSIELDYALPPPSSETCGQHLFLQVFLSDPAATHGFAFSSGEALTLGSLP